MTKQSLITASIGLVVCKGKYYMEIITAAEYCFYYVEISKATAKKMSETDHIEISKRDAGKWQQQIVDDKANALTIQNKMRHALKVAMQYVEFAKGKGMIGEINNDIKLIQSAINDSDSTER